MTLLDWLPAGVVALAEVAVFGPLAPPATVVPMVSSCADNEEHYERWGYTASATHFRLDNSTDSAEEGLMPYGFYCGSACNSCLELELGGEQGLLLVR